MKMPKTETQRYRDTCLAEVIRQAAKDNGGNRL